MSDTGWLDPSATENNSGWVNPNNIFAQDSAYATVPFATGTAVMTVYNFSISIPAGATIDGIQVRAYCAYSGDGTGLLPFKLYYLTRSSLAPNFKYMYPTGSYIYRYAGGSTDTWGRTWAPGDFTNANFGVRTQGVISGGSYGDIDVDHLQVRVFYTASAGIDFDGSGQSISTGSGVFTTIKQFAGSGSSASSGSGLRNTQKPFSGNGGSVSTGNGVLLTRKPFAGNGESISAGSGLLGGLRAFGGSGASVGDGSGLFVTQKPFSGNGESVSSGSGLLGGLRAFGGSGASVSNGSGLVSLIKFLSGLGESISSGNGVLIDVDQFFGIGRSENSGGGVFITKKQFSGIGGSESSGSGLLTTQKPFSGNGESVSAGSGLFTTQKPFSGSGESVSAGNGFFITKKYLDGLGETISNGFGLFYTDDFFGGLGETVSTGFGVFQVRKRAHAYSCASCYKFQPGEYPTGRCRAFPPARCCSVLVDQPVFAYIADCNATWCAAWKRKLN